uniref:EOG090X0MWD n=1 Tax=Lynceus sp. MCZ IZ 141354 TaxID=1930659 RepID=A0A9N6ZEW9_9CRUS|nr:EOG090X0MWD [Lynceus sp. MCZ IZ 141354]
MSAVDQKVEKFETYLNDVLRESLKSHLSEQNKICDEIAEYLKLKNLAEVLQRPDVCTTPLKTKVDLGCNFYVQAEAPDASKLLVSVGFGFFVELTLEEVVTFVDKKVALLKNASAHVNTEIAEIKARIDVMLQGLRELQNISGEIPSEPRFVF